MLPKDLFVRLTHATRVLKHRARNFLKWVSLVTPLRPLGRILFMRPFWCLLHKLAKKDTQAPKVSIVMAVWNNRTMVGDAIRSARAQSWPNLQLIVVDDGSTDGTAELVDRFASSSVNVIHQANAGPGAARNRGVDEIGASDYLVFLDSDDLLPIHGVRRLVESAESSGSPLVIGKLERFDGIRRFDRRDNVAVYAHDRRAITIDDEPRVLSDANISGKLFRTDFWKSSNARFPEGVVYEDMHVVVGAYLSAPAFDIVSKCVNLWRVRGEGQSITQKKTEVKSLADRLTAIERIYDQLSQFEKAGRIGPRVRESYLERIISLDLQLFVVKFGDAGQDYFDMFAKRAKALLAAATEQTWNNSSGANKDVVRLALTSTREQTLRRLAEKGIV
jgi:CDP-glycerol glycerophosphotransferase